MKRYHLSVLLFLNFFVTACAQEPGSREIRVSLQVPDSAWTVEIKKVVELEEHLWVLAEVDRPEDVMGVSVISDVNASVEVAAPDLPLKMFVVGKTWNWEGEEGYAFLENEKQFEEKVKGGKVLFQRMHDLGI